MCYHSPFLHDETQLTIGRGFCLRANFDASPSAPPTPPHLKYAEGEETVLSEFTSHKPLATSH